MERRQQQLAFISSSRDHKRAQFRVADAQTGKSATCSKKRAKRISKVATIVRTGGFYRLRTKLIWFSERDNWGQLYLYDLTTGKLKNQITSGEGDVAETLRVDETNRLVYFLGVGKEKGRDPYFVHLYRVGLDGKNQTLLTPEDATHDVSFSPTGRFFVDSYSKPDSAGITVLRDSAGKLIRDHRKSGYFPARRHRLEAGDALFCQSARRRHRPVWSDVQTNAIRRRTKVSDHRPHLSGTDAGQRRHTPLLRRRAATLRRSPNSVSSSSNSMEWGLRHGPRNSTMRTTGIWATTPCPIRSPGSRNSRSVIRGSISSRVGIWGHSGGGYAAADAMFRYPDFFKVGISEAGNHDNRDYEDDWAEKWQGLLNGNNYDNQANELVARNLKGKLLLVHGTMDSNVPPYNTLLVVDALIRANKDFDLLMLPNRNHGFANEPYMIRRRWDYFVRNLMGAEPPKEYEMKR